MFLVTNMKRVLYQIVAFLFTAISSCSAINALGNCKNCVSPYDFGLANAKSGIERYQVLLKTHHAAVSSGVDVDYTGIDTVRIEIPVKASRIPLTRYNDFKGCVFQVKNRTNNTWLFTIENKETPITVDKRRIDSGDFRSIDSLKHGRVLLLIEDENPWVQNRKGYSYGHQRRDILLIENAIAKNSVIMPYNNEFGRNYGHILQIDRHRPWTDPDCVRIIDRVEPKYLTHELSSGPRRSQLGAVRRQLGTIRRGRENK